MHREILFRAKALDGDVWVTGDLHIRTPHPHIERLTAKMNININTIGQYIGVQDRKGKPIYEGDILRVEVKLTEASTERVVKLGYVEYSVKETAFVLVTDNMVMALGSRNLDPKVIEVIGNVVDDTDLIEHIKLEA